MNNLPLIRKSNPSLLASQIKPVSPITHENITYEQSQTVRVFDPRLILDFSPCNHGDKVQIQRIIQNKQINGNTIIKLCNVSVIEIIKEYSFDEWDKALSTNHETL